MAAGILKDIGDPTFRILAIGPLQALAIFEIHLT